MSVWESCATYFFLWICPLVEEKLWNENEASVINGLKVLVIPIVLYKCCYLMPLILYVQESHHMTFLRPPEVTMSIYLIPLEILISFWHTVSTRASHDWFRGRKFLTFFSCFNCFTACFSLKKKTNLQTTCQFFIS